MTDRTDQRMFYMIARAPTHAGSKTTPTKRYSDFVTAQDEARSLARQTGHRFVVLGVLAVVETKDDLTPTLL